MTGPTVTDELTHVVYLHRSAAGRLLYIGCTKNLKSRTSLHKSGWETASPWWPYVASVEVDSAWPSREAALQRERTLIGELRPPGNRQHNPDGAYGEHYTLEAVTRLLGGDSARAWELTMHRANVHVYAELLFSDDQPCEVPA